MDDPVLWLLIALALNVVQSIVFVLHLRSLREERLTLTKILASRTLTEYARAEKTLDPAFVPEPKEPSYEQAWEIGDNNG